MVLPLKSFTLDDGKRDKYKIKAESVKTGQSVKIEFFEALLNLKLENLKLNKGRKNPDTCGQTFSATDDVLWFLGFANSEEQKSVSRQQTHNLVFLSLEAILGTKNQNKKIQGSC